MFYFICIIVFLVVTCVRILISCQNVFVSVNNFNKTDAASFPMQAMLSFFLQLIKYLCIYLRLCNCTLSPCNINTYIFFLVLGDHEVYMYVVYI